MTPETRYKLISLACFFALFAALFAQFLHPYISATAGPGLADNPLVLYLVIAAGLLLAIQTVLYFPLRKSMKFLSLLAPVLIMALLVTAHVTLKEKNLDAKTRKVILERMNGPKPLKSFAPKEPKK